MTNPKASCAICTKEKSNFYMGHRQLCFRCDELLIDLEMEIAPDDAKDGVDLELRGGGEEIASDDTLE